MKKKKRGRRPLTNKEFGDKFHKDVEQLLLGIGMDIKESNYAGEGPDIVARDRETKSKIIIQCKATRTSRVFTRIGAITKEYAQWRREYRADVAIIALNGYKLKKNLNLDQLYTKTKVIVLTRETLKEYFDLYKKIGSHAKYQILSDLGLFKRVAAKPLRVKALKVNQPGFDFLVAAIPAWWLLKTASVYRRIGSHHHVRGYQRVLNKKRVRDEIPEYLREKDWGLPNAVICATQLGARRRLHLDRNDVVSIPAKTGALWVIDGQHRLYSFSNVSDEVRKNELLTVIIDSARLGDKSEIIQADLFYKLNTHAQRIKRSLVLDLLMDLLTTSIPELRVAFKLSKSSVLRPVVRTYSRAEGLVDIVTLSSTAPMKQLSSKSGPIIRSRNLEAAASTNVVADYLEAYFKVVRTVFKNEWNNPKFIICENRGFRALLRVLLYLVNKHRTSSRANVLKVAKISLKKLKGSGTFRIEANKNKWLGEGGANELAEQWIKAFSGVNIPEVIPKKEGQHVEFKETFRYDINTHEKNGQLPLEVCKAVSAFQNAEGGTVLIGVNDKGRLIGIERDLRLVGKGGDRQDVLLRQITQALRNELGPTPAAAAQVNFKKKQNKTYVTITVDRREKPVYMRHTKFYYRHGAECVSPPLDEMNEYIRDHFYR